MKNRRTFEITLTSIIIGIILLLSVIPQIGFIVVIPGLIAFTTIHIPVILGSIILGRRYAWIFGLVFGLFSIITAFTIFAGNPSAVFFQNPLISVLPRVLFSVLTFEIYNLLRNKLSNKTLYIILTILISTLIHTILVLSAIMIFGIQGNLLSEDFFNMLFTAIKINSLFEVGIALLIGTPVIMRVTGYLETEYE